MTKIGLVGKGFVGEAFYEGMKDHYSISVWDTDPTKRNVESLLDLVSRCNVIFVSVPTPMLPNGSCDTSIVESVVDQINRLATTTKIVVIRSTVPPGTCERLNKFPYGVCVVFNPEFLTEANYINDFKNQTRIVLGGMPEHTTIVEELYSKSFPGIPVVKTNWKTAEMVKYVANTFLSVKVSFANEIYDICSADNIDYESVIRIATLDGRLGASHWKVPGPDGHRGFGGTCVLPTTKIMLFDGSAEEIRNCKHKKVLSTNETIDKLDIKLVENLIFRDYSGELIEFNIEGNVFTCTPDHLIPVERNGAFLLLQAKYVGLEDVVYIYRNDIQLPPNPPNVHNLD